MNNVRNAGLLMVVIFLASCSGSPPTADPVAALSTQVARADSQYASASAERDSLQQENGQLKKQIDQDVSSLKQLQAQIASMRGDLTNATTDLAKYKCDVTPPDLPYNQIYNDSAVLMGWVAKQSWAERVSSTSRETVFTNTETKIQSVFYYSSQDHKQYVTKFLVFHYDPDYGTVNSILWIDGAGNGPCWLVR